jgi:hypothetical protein
MMFDPDVWYRALKKTQLQAWKARVGRHFEEGEHQKRRCGILRVKIDGWRTARLKRLLYRSSDLVENELADKVEACF